MKFYITWVILRKFSRRDLKPVPFFPNLDILSNANDNIQVTKTFYSNGYQKFSEYPYPLKNILKFKSLDIWTIRFGIETAPFIGSRTWSHSDLNELRHQTNFLIKNKILGVSKLPFQISNYYITLYYMLLDAFIFVSIFVCLFCWGCYCYYIRVSV